MKKVINSMLFTKFIQHSMIVINYKGKKHLFHIAESYVYFCKYIQTISPF